VIRSVESRHDDLGDAIAVPDQVRRVVSLVPSLTESVAVTAPGLLVGATDWCTHPRDLKVARVRGTKNPDVAAVVALQPDLVLANQEENRVEDLDALRAAGLAVWVTAPTTVTGALRSLERMLEAACRLPAPSWLREAGRAWRAPYNGPHRRAFVPIWRKPWMCLGRDTFAGDVLARLGVGNVFADDVERYPKVTLDAARQRRPDVVVLPDEPYAFTRDEGQEVFGSWQVPVAHVSGRHLTWYGPSLAEARTVLAAELNSTAQW
jgi:ABC-type Fe3+-hydroxamate transport system substrate-binding protein